MHIRLIGGWLLSLFTTYLATAIATLLLTGTVGIVNNGNILTDGRDKRKYLENKYNDLSLYVDLFMLVT